MEGDFSRNSDDPKAHFTAVLMQQGRVQLDADWNEQAAIQTRALRDAMRDLIGPHGGPGRAGFEVTVEDGKILVGDGVYYVDGIRVEKTPPLDACGDPRRDCDEDDVSCGATDGVALAFLEVWERHVNVIEAPQIREVALLGPDTATRAELRWRVRLLYRDDCHKDAPNPCEGEPCEAADKWLEALRCRPLRRLAARVDVTKAPCDPCAADPEARYRGHENQLYRVEIHDGKQPPCAADEEAEVAQRGKKQAGRDASSPVLFTFKWSRDNGAVVFPIIGPFGASDEGAAIPLGHLGRDDRDSLAPGDIVEFVDDERTTGALDREPIELGEPDQDPGRGGPVGKVTEVDRDTLTVTVDFYGDAPEFCEGRRPYLRRWDQREPKPGAKVDGPAVVGGVVQVRACDLDTWIDLEHGVQVRFCDCAPEPRGGLTLQRAGDYWQIPARAATGTVLWPKRGDEACCLRPHGVARHYAPLAFVRFEGDRAGCVMCDVRRRFEALARCVRCDPRHGEQAMQGAPKPSPVQVTNESPEQNQAGRPKKKER